MACSRVPKVREFHTLEDFDGLPSVPYFVVDELNSKYRDLSAEKLEQRLKTEKREAFWLGVALNQNMIYNWRLPKEDVTKILLASDVKELYPGFTDFLEKTLFELERKKAKKPVDEAVARRRFMGMISWLDPLHGTSTDYEFVLECMLNGDVLLDDQTILAMHQYLNRIFKVKQLKGEYPTDVVYFWSEFYPEYTY